jgi:hypothetical protein
MEANQEKIETNQQKMDSSQEKIEVMIKNGKRE